jgi:hypothetical protein
MHTLLNIRVNLFSRSPSTKNIPHHQRLAPPRALTSTMDRAVLPIEPHDASLGSHLAAFDSLIAALLQLPSRTRWPVHVPLNAKARIRGEAVHTNDVTVCLGAGWWVDMTAAEAVAHLQRKKAGEWAGRAWVEARGGTWGS